jgi:hypothetical protein
MDWRSLTAALVGATVTVAGSVIWNLVDRRRAATEALVAEATAAFDLLLEAVASTNKAWLPALRGRGWVHQLIRAESARTKLIVHLSPRRWRSKRLGLRMTLQAEGVAFRDAALKHAEKDSEATRRQLSAEVHVVAAALACWAGHRRSYLRGNILDELRRTAQSDTPRQPARSPGWWRWLRPGITHRENWPSPPR